MTLLELQDLYYTPLNRFVSFHVKQPWVAEDIVQETFLKAHTYFHTLQDPSKARTWLYTIAWNLCLNYFQKAKKQNEISAELFQLKHNTESLQQKVEQNEMGVCVQEKMKLLPSPLKQVLSLYEVEDFSHRDISQILGITVQTSKTRLHRARKKFKEILQKECSFHRDGRNVFVCTPKEDKSVDS